MTKLLYAGRNEIRLVAANRASNAMAGVKGPVRLIPQ
jgi:hypothetical protein